MWAFLLLTLTFGVPRASTSCQFIADSRTGDRGNFQSPGWPSPYPPDSSCSYKLQGSEWQGVKIIFHQFDLEAKFTEGCLMDYLELTTVDIRGQRTFRGRFCGSELPPPILVLHPTAELEFRSNQAVHHSGFLASYEFVDEANIKPPSLNGTSPCGSTEVGMGGIIQSPNFPYGYVAGLDCLWLIRVKYNHAIYLRIQELEFQGSITNCQKAQLIIYDGYENSFDEPTILKKFCGDTRNYKAEEDRVLLSARNRVLVRFTTTEPSKPVADSNVGFRLIWSDVEFDTPENCTKNGRFACKEARYCFTKNHLGGASNCPDIRHYCISSRLVCDGVPHCGENRASDEESCHTSGLILIGSLAGSILFLLSGIFCCFFCFYYKGRPRRGGILINSPMDKKNGRFFCWRRPGERKVRTNNLVQMTQSKILLGMGAGGGDPIPRPTLSFKCPPNDLESPVTSDIVSPASGFSDTESELSHVPHHLPPVPSAPYCPAHGPVALVPLRYLSRQFPLLPVVQEQSYSDTYDEGGSTYSSQNSDIIVYEENNKKKDNSEKGNFVNEWRLRQVKRVLRSDAVYFSDDAKSSITSSPGRVCSRCLEKEPRSVEKQNCKESMGVQFDSGIDVIDSTSEMNKNVSFDSQVTSSDSAMSRDTLLADLFQWRIHEDVTNQSIQTDDISSNGHCACGLALLDSPYSSNTYCSTVTTFGVNPDTIVKSFTRNTDV